MSRTKKMHTRKTHNIIGTKFPYYKKIFSAKFEKN